MSTAFATLRRFAAKAADPNPTPEEHCDLCDAVVFHQHRHLIDPTSRRILCACQACSLLFPATAETKYRKVPDTVRFLEHFQLTAAQWDDLLIPIGLAFFLKTSMEKRVLALYPSPAGPTESLLSLHSWSEIVSENPALEHMDADVEALLVNRLGDPAEYYLAPIDKCYHLVGLIRANWQGLSGGAEMWAKTRLFFEELKEAARA